MKYKIVSDSASNILTLEQIPFASVPLHILVNSHDFIDDADVDLKLMEEILSSFKGRSSTACPGVNDWLQAFGDAETVFCVTITSSLSGSYNSAVSAKKEYEEAHPGRLVHVIDSLSAGPEMALILEKLQELCLSGKERETIIREVQAYTQRTRLLFSLENLKNLANNGRVNPAVAKLAGILGIRVIGQASSKGELELLNKCRGAQCVLSNLVKYIERMGYKGGKILIAHNDNEKTAAELAARIRETFHTADIRIGRTQALCSFYAEKGGLMIGVEC